jgi:uncharacterized membrane protein YgdD (TMEM256/DUF423 family)
MKKSKGKLMMGLAACFAGLLATVGAYATWVFTKTAATTESETINVGTAVNVTGVTVTSGTSTLNLASPASSAWSVTSWDVAFAGDLSGMASGKVDWTATVPPGFTTYCSMATSGSLTGYSSSALSKPFTLPTVSYVSTFVSAGSVVGGYATYAAMKNALNNAIIKFTFTATVTSPTA